MSAHSSTDVLIDSLFSRPNHHSRRVALCTLGAVMIHALTAGAFIRTPHAAAAPKVLEVELLAPPPPAPPPPAALPEPTPAPEPSETPKAFKPPVAAQPAGTPPPAAAAGALLTAKADSTPAQATPLDFTSDPNSQVWGSGVVAVGGTAKVGLPGATIGGRPTPRPAPVARQGAGDGLVAFQDLSRRPQLTAVDPCHGYFPASANADSALVVLRIVVTAEGRARSVQLVSETPSDQGFGTAARSCISSQNFVSALDKDGRPVSTSTSITVRFRR